MNMSREDAFFAALVNLDEETAIDLCEALLRGGTPRDAIFDVIARAMAQVGTRYERMEYFLAELITAGETVKDVLALVDAHHQRSDAEYAGTIVLATVKGDLHDIGKNIMAMLLRSTGFKVIDMGVDQPPARIVETVRETDATILGLSALLTTTSREVKHVVEALDAAGIREHVKVIIGGAGVNAEIAARYGVDGFAKTATNGLKVCRKWVT
jgi:methylmalonyl-CoA mutase cobalamin-binding domain/chain